MDSGLWTVAGKIFDILFTVLRCEAGVRGVPGGPVMVLLKASDTHTLRHQGRLGEAGALQRLPGDG